MTNPYAAPRSRVADGIAEAIPQRHRAPRPFAAWVVLGLCGTLAALFWWGAGRHLLAALWADTDGTATRSLLNAAILAVIAGGPTLAALAIHQRRRAGRWLGAAVLAVLEVIFLASADPTPAAAAADAAYLAGKWTAVLCTVLLTVGLAYAAGWSGKAARYYAA